MPEGHSIFRHAAEHRELLVGQEVSAESPQGRFSRGAARINGRRLLDIETHGKHLFYRWERAETLHVHLGLYGKFRVFATDAPRPTPATRLAMRANGVTIYLAGPTVCELIMPSREEAIRARLGPDPLRSRFAGNSSAAFAENLSRRTIPIGAAVIDQSVIAGLGNIYRAEVLFLAGVHPSIPANEVPAEKVREMWDISAKLLRKGVKEGKITTVPRRGARRNANERVFVYQRDRHRVPAVWRCDLHGRIGQPDPVVVRDLPATFGPRASRLGLPVSNSPTPTPSLDVPELDRHASPVDV